MIRKLTEDDLSTILHIINESAFAYKGKIPSDCYKEPYMPQTELEEEIQSGVQFYGWIEDAKVVAVMGIQPVNDITLIRHAYTLTSHQRRGIGEKLLHHLLTLAQTKRILVGTWEDASWAIKFYQKNGFKLQTRAETNKLLKKYWNINQRQIETSVVLQQERSTP